MNSKMNFNSPDMTTIFVRNRSSVSYPLVPENQQKKFMQRRKAIRKNHKQSKRRISHPAFYFEAIKLLQSIGYK